MKKTVVMAVLAATLVAFVGCKKEETLGDKVDKAAKEAQKEAADLQKKLDKALEK